MCRLVAKIIHRVQLTLLVPQSLDEKGGTKETVSPYSGGWCPKRKERNSSQKMEGHTELNPLQHEVN